MNNRGYWAKRFRALEERAHAEAEKCVAESMKLIQDEVTQIDKDINYWLRRYADNNNITLAEAKKSISNKELEELGWDVEEYIRKGRANAYTGEWTTELENASARYHLTRLDAIKLQIQKCCDTAFTGIVQNMTKSLSEVYKDVQYRAAYEIQKESGIYSSFAQVDENKLRMILERPWAVDGMNFSQRVWGSYRPKLTNKLQQALTDWCVRGTDPKKLAKALSYESGVAQSACNTLIRTETAQICTRAEMDCYDELGVEKYRILETLDDRTCDVCADMDGKVFKRSEYEVGITAPPFHPRCRGTTIPEVDDALLKQGRMRAARNDKGKTTYVEDMSYKEWKEKFVGNDQFTNSSNNDIINLDTARASGDKLSPLKPEYVPENIKEYLNSLQEDGDSLTLDSRPTIKDLSLLSRQTGVEFAALSVNGKNILIRGNSSATTISSTLFEELEKHKGTLNYHSHPFIGDIIPSKADLSVAKMMYWQDKFKIVSVDGITSLYNKNGIIETGTVENIILETDKSLFEELFKELL